MLFDDQYLTIEDKSQGLFRDKGSRFISYAIPVSSEEEVKAELELIRKEYYDATHHCYSYVLGPDKSAFRQNDDGEPSGTAGRPIYGQILSSDLTNILVVVVRYYGGTKLGVPGLINAYKTSAKEAIDNARKIVYVVRERYRIEYEYILMNEVMKTLKDEGVDILFSDFGMKCVIEFSIRKMHASRVNTRLSRITGLNISYLSIM